MAELGTYMILLNCGQHQLGSSSLQQVNADISIVSVGSIQVGEMMLPEHQEPDRDL